MRILNSIVLPSPPLVPAFDPKDPDCGAVRSQVVGDQSLGNEGVRPQELAHQFQRSVLISLGPDQHIEDLALGVDGPPEIDHAAVDFQIDLVEMPSRVRFQATLSRWVNHFGPMIAADLRPRPRCHSASTQGDKSAAFRSSSKMASSALVGPSPRLARSAVRTMAPTTLACHWRLCLARLLAFMILFVEPPRA